MNILISGASGLIGTALTRYFQAAGHRVIPLCRNNTGNPFTWQPARGVIFLDDNEVLDVVINLAGPGIAERRWTRSRKHEILAARVQATEVLSQALARREQKPRVFLSASAIGFYGPRDDTPVDETAGSGSGFLAEVARHWEAATEAAEVAGIRTVHTRFGIVLDTGGGVLREMLPPFRFGLGGVIGSGRQFMSWIAMTDLLHAMDFLVQHDSLSGAVNLVAPHAVSNREFTSTLGRVLKRPTWIPLPAPLARLLFGEMADELLLTGVRVTPARLLQTGFRFQQPELEAALRSALGS